VIARLAGTLLEKSPDRILVDVQGVGYRVFVSFRTFEDLPEEGAPVALRIHTHVREDALALFGFAADREQKLFEMLIAVAGVGPRLAMTLLSGIPTADLVRALAGGDTRRLVAIPGVGRKTADRLVLELKDRVGALVETEARPAAGVPAEDVVSALVNFGYKKADADRVVDAITRGGAPSDFGQFVKAALAALTGG
jgi:Holliday junction DNA helicase RuvA